MSNAHEFVGETFNMKRIKEIVTSELSWFEESHDTLGEEGIYVFDIVSGSLGQYQQKSIAEFFKIDLDSDGIADTHSFIKEVEDYLSESIGLKGNFNFGYLESDNCFGLFYNE
jgi:hypothetical protein